jgi:hypothetical protein
VHKINIETDWAKMVKKSLIYSLDRISGGAYMCKIEKIIGDNLKK